MTKGLGSLAYGPLREQHDIVAFSMTSAAYTHAVGFLEALQKTFVLLDSWRVVC